jgi:hypothetical protein
MESTLRNLTLLLCLSFFAFACDSDDGADPAPPGAPDVADNGGGAETTSGDATGPLTLAVRPPAGCELAAPPEGFAYPEGPYGQRVNHHFPPLSLSTCEGETCPSPRSRAAPS